MLEELFKTRWAEKRPSYSLYLGVVYTSIAFVTSFLLFSQAPTFIGVSTILLTVVLIVPTVNKLFDREEKLEAKERLSFFIKHEHIIDFFLYFFIGVFLVLFLVALSSPSLVFSEQQLYGSVVGEKVAQPSLPPPPPIGESSDFSRILKNNVLVMLIAFVLSLFYGSGALFLITLNASIFASALAQVVRASMPTGFIQTYSFMLCNVAILFFHLVPEVFAYLLAAIAGGVLSHALVREKLGSKNFRAVLTDSFVLLFAAGVFLVVAAFIENEISKKLLTGDVCTNSWLIVGIVLFILLACLIFFELHRNKHHRRKKKSLNRKSTKRKR